MTYCRVIPRDLFNEASLLKCLGQLALRLEDRVPGHKARLDHFDDGPFHIGQDESDGSIMCLTIRLLIGDEPCALYRPLNSREPFPLWVKPWQWGGLEFEDTLVLTEDGSLTPEFERLVGL